MFTGNNLNMYHLERGHSWVSLGSWLVSITTTVAAETADIPTKVGLKFDFLMDIKYVSGVGMHWAVVSIVWSILHSAMHFKDLIFFMSFTFKNIAFGNQMTLLIHPVLLIMYNVRSGSP